MEEIENQIRSIEQGQDRLSRDDERRLCDLKKRLGMLRKETHRHNMYLHRDWIGCVMLNWYDMKSLKRGVKLTWRDDSSWGESIPACSWYIEAIVSITDNVKIQFCTSVRVSTILCPALLFTDSAMEYK